MFETLLGTLATGALTKLFGGGSDNVDVPAQTAQYNPWYDDALTQYLQDRKKVPAGFVKPEDYNFMGQMVRPGAMKEYGDFSSMMNPSINAINEQIQSLKNAGIGYQGNEVNAMYDTMNRKLEEASRLQKMKMAASVGARGLRGGAMTDAMIQSDRAALDAREQGVRDILLGAAEARRNDFNTKGGLMNNALSLGSEAAGKAGVFAQDANQRNIGLWNQMADPMRYQEFVTKTLLGGSGAAQSAGQLGTLQSTNAINATKANNDANSDFWSGILWGGNRGTQGGLFGGGTSPTVSYNQIPTYDSSVKRGTSYKL